MTTASRRCLTTLATALLLIALSYQVSPASATASSSPPYTVSPSSTVGRALQIGEAVWKKLMAAKQLIVDRALAKIGWPTTDDVLGFLWRAVIFISKSIFYLVRDRRERVETVLSWVVDSILNPFRSLTSGMRAFFNLFRYIHKIRRDTAGGFGGDNAVYQCFNSMHPKCVARANTLESVLVYQCYCAWEFYEKCQLHYWFKKGMWKVPDMIGDICHMHPTGKCPDQAPNGHDGRW